MPKRFGRGRGWSMGPLTPKVKHPQHLSSYRYRGNDHDRETLFYCDRCRIKDGLISTRLKYGTCSFCGWKGRCNVASTYSSNLAPPMSVDRKHKSWWRFNRESLSNVWSRNRKDK